jgi:hypothetical protein
MFIDIGVSGWDEAVSRGWSWRSTKSALRRW